MVQSSIVLGYQNIPILVLKKRIGEYVYLRKLTTWYAGDQRLRSFDEKVDIAVNFGESVCLAVVRLYTGHHAVKMNSGLNNMSNIAKDQIVYLKRVNFNSVLAGLNLAAEDTGITATKFSLYVSEETESRAVL